MSNWQGERRPWQPLTDEALRDAVRQRVREAAELLREAGAVRERAIAQSQGEFREVQWYDLSLGSGYPGLCLLLGELDRLEPDAGWDLAGHQVLLAVQQAVSQRGISSLDLWGGLAGIGMGVRALSRGGTRYTGMLAAFHKFAAEQLPGFIAERTARMAADLRMTDYDLMGGMTGIGRFLLAFRDEPLLQPALEQVLRYLVALSGDKEIDGRSVPMWHIPPANHFLPAEREQYRQGSFNLGLSHGIAGPMGLLALAMGHGVQVAGQERAIRRYAQWLCEQMLEDAAGPYWPGRLPMEAEGDGRQVRAKIPPHESWCYGAPGIARQLWFAGAALGETSWQNRAVEALLATFRRPPADWGLSLPNFCHGLAGLAHAAQVMHAETGNETFARERDLLVEQLLDRTDASPPFGSLSQPGLLEGLAGTLLVLSGMTAEEAPEWDQVFMMS